MNRLNQSEKLIFEQDQKTECFKCQKKSVSYDALLRACICEICGLVAEDHIIHPTGYNDQGEDCGRFMLTNYNGIVSF